MKSLSKKHVFRKLGSFLMAASLATSNFLFTKPLDANAQGSGGGTSSVSSSEFITSATIYDQDGDAIPTERIRYVNGSGVDLNGFGISPQDLGKITEDEIEYYTIENCSQFLKFAIDPHEYNDLTVILTSDIDFSGYCTPLKISGNKVTATPDENGNVWLFQPIVATLWLGSNGMDRLDGRGHTIDGLVVHSNVIDSSKSSYVGVFSEVNIHAGVNWYDDDCIQFVQFGSNCQVVASYTGSGAFRCGAIAGSCESTIKGCGWYGSVYCYDGSDDGNLTGCGCLAGYQSSTDPSSVTNCFIGGKFRFACKKEEIAGTKTGSKLIDAAVAGTNILHPDLNVAALANVTAANISEAPETSDVSVSGLTSVTQDQIKSGEACYLLNHGATYNNPADVGGEGPDNAADFIWRQNLDSPCITYPNMYEEEPTPRGSRVIADNHSHAGKGGRADSREQYCDAVFRIGYNSAYYYTNNFYKLIVLGVDNIGAHGELTADVGAPLDAELLYIEKCPDKYKHAKTSIKYRWYFKENATNIVSETDKYTVAGDKAGHCLVVEAINTQADPNDNVIALRLIHIKGEPIEPLGDKEVVNGTYPDGIRIINYERSDGATAAFTRPYGEITWVKERSGDDSTWYGLQDSEKVFTEESTFWVKWINKEENPEEWDRYYAMLDEEHKKIANNNMHIFICGVTSPEGKEYTDFGGKSVKLYVQLGGKWNKEKIKAVFLKKNSDGQYDEAVTVEFKDDMEGPDGEISDYAVLTLKHFSPYAVFDSVEEFDEDFVATGDNALTIVVVLVLLMAVAGLVMFITKKKNKPIAKN